MKLYKTTLTPLSSFATQLKGDTFFGMLCWAIRYKFGEDRLKDLIKDYDKNPFLIVSDGFLSGFLPKPTMPSKMLGEEKEHKKENRKKLWLSYEDFEKSKFTNAKTIKDVAEILKNKGAKICATKSEITTKNTINYLSFTADDPYSELEFVLPPQDIYILLNEDRFSLKELGEAVYLMGHIGYGKNASTGKGRFKVNDFVEVVQNCSRAFMTISPCVLQGVDGIKDCFYEPFTRFGKHGGYLASTGRFEKNPLLLVNTGAVVVFEKSCDIKFIGKMITGHSEQKDTIHQGYSIVLPLKLEEE